MGSARSPGTYRVNTVQNRNLDERKFLGSTSSVAKTGEFVGHYRGTLLKAAKKFSPSFSVIRMGSRGTFVLCTASSRRTRIDVAERHYLVKVGHRLSTARLSTGQCLLVTV